MRSTILSIISSITSILGIPSGIIYFAFPDYYKQHVAAVWVCIGILMLIVVALHLPNKYSPKFVKTVRKIRFYILNTKVLSSLLVIQLLTIFIWYIISPDHLPQRLLLSSIFIGIIGLYLLILNNNIPNTDAKKILLRKPNGHIYLYEKNRLKFIPDPITFNLLGFKWTDPINISNEDFSSYEIGLPFTSATEMNIKIHNHIVYGIDNGILRAFPNEHTLNRLMEHRINKEVTALENIDGYKIGDPFVTAWW